jgi:hypothetical protein
MAYARNVIEVDRLCRLREFASLLDHYTTLGLDARLRLSEGLQKITSDSVSEFTHGQREAMALCDDYHSPWDLPDDSLVYAADPAVGEDIEPPIDWCTSDESQSFTDRGDLSRFDESDTSALSCNGLSGSPLASAKYSNAPPDILSANQTRIWETPAWVSEEESEEIQPMPIKQGQKNEDPSSGLVCHASITESLDPLPPIHAESSLHQEATPPESTRAMDTDLVSTFSSLYFAYRQSTSNFTSLATSEEDSDRTNYAMTRNQLRLTLEEGQLWDSLLTPLSSSSQTTTKTSLTLLSERSNLMLESFQRRVNPATRQTYEESKAMLKVMGIPCVDATGPFEAEALASSLVINGFADYVASEDTVCTDLYQFNINTHWDIWHRMSWFTKHP